MIGINFTPSREYREHIERRYINERSFGATAGDSFWLGLGTYDVVNPFARYRDEEESKPITNPFWRARIEKAKTDRERHREQVAWQQLGENSAVVFAADDVAGLIDLVKGAFYVE